MRKSTMVALFLSLGCSTKSGDSGDATPPDCSENNGDWPVHVCPITDGSPISADLASGRVLEHLEWADESDVACFPGTENTNFEGAHLLYWIDQPESTTLTATASPDSGVDVSVYILQMGTTLFQVPPDVSSVVSCEAGFDQTGDSNPGEAETTSVIATTNPYNVLIGVAGAAGVESGGFTLSVTLD